MVKKPKQATKAANIKEQLEAIVGSKIDVSEQQLAKFSYPVGSFSVVGGAVTWKSVFPFASKTCSGHAFLELVNPGRWQTRVSGQRRRVLLCIRR